MAFPSTLTPTLKTDWSNTTPVENTHPDEHNSVAADVEALKTKVGINSSADTNSLDYKLKNSGSISPGHKHTSADITDLPTTVKATASVYGNTRLTQDPAVADTPIAVGANTSLSGTAISTGNKAVDEASVSNAGASDKIVKLNGTTYPAGDGSNLTNLRVGKTSKTFTAGAAITAGNALAIYPYHTDGGITIQTSGSSTALSTSINVGTGSNRALVVFVTTGTAGANITAASYGGTALTLVSTSGSFHLGGYVMRTYLILNPTSGTNTLDFTVSAGSIQLTYYALNGVKQSAQPDASKTDTATPSGGGSVSLSTVVSGSLMLSCAANNNTFTDTAAYNTNQTVAGFVGQSSYTSSPVYPGATSVTATVGSNGGTGAQCINMISLAPATTPTDVTVVPASAATATNQWVNKYAGFVGFAESTVSAGASVVVTVGGEATGISTTLSAIGKQYYISDTAGALSLTAGTNTRKAALSTGTTSAIVTNIW